MIAFALAAAAMVALAVACVLVPLVRRRGAAAIDRDASNIAILRDQLRDLEADHARGAIDDAAYAQARDELERRVLDDVGERSTERAPERGTPWAAVAAAGLIPVSAVLLYLAIGTPGALVAGPPRGAEPNQQFSAAELEGMAAKLAARLENDRDNLQGWVMLARSYYVLRKFDDAARAYERALALSPDNADLLADYADSLAVGQGGKIAGRPLELVERALAIDPTHWKALALAGSAAFERKDFARAIAYWEKLKAVAPPDSPLAQSIDASIAEARELGGLKSPALALAGKGATAAAKDAPPPGADAKGAAAPAARVSGTVRLEAGLAARAAPEDAVFVFARAAEGPRVPLAVLRKQVKDLPLEFTLDDSMAMAPNLKLSGFAEVVVGARISKSGSATPQAGDLQGLSGPVRVGASGVSVLIDRPVP